MPWCQCNGQAGNDLVDKQVYGLLFSCDYT